MTFALGGIAVWMPYYLEHRPGVHRFPTTSFGVVLLATGLLGTLLGGLAGDRLRNRYWRIILFGFRNRHVDRMSCGIDDDYGGISMDLGIHFRRVLLPLFQGIQAS